MLFNCWKINEWPCRCRRWDRYNNNNYLFTVCVDQSAPAAVATGEAWKQLVLCAPFSFVPPASKASHLPFLLHYKQIFCLSRTTHRAGGHVAWLVSSETEFRGRPPSQCGVDVRSCVSCRSHCYLFVYAHKRVPRHQGLVAESVLYECMWLLENIWVETRRLCSFFGAEWWLKVIYFAFTV